MTGTYLTRHVWRNVGAATVSMVFSLGSQAVFLYVMAQAFGPANYGIVTLATTLLFATTAIAAFGSETFGMRLIASGGSDPHPVQNLLLTFQLLNAIALVGAVLLAIPFLAASRMECVFVSIMTVVAIPDIIIAVTGTSFYGREQFAPFVTLSVISSCALVAATLVAASLDASLITMGGVLLMLRSLTAVGAGVLHRRCIGSLRLVTPGLAYRQLARRSIPYFLISVLAVIHMKADIPMVRMMCGTVELGLYGLAAMVANAAASGIRPLVAPLFPAVARAGGAGTVLYPSRALRTLLVPLATGTVVAIAIFVLAGPLIRSWLGPDYAGSIRPLRILAWFVPMIFVSTTALRMMMACGKTGPTIRILAVNGVINIGANALLIPHAGITGAAIATVLSTTASALQSVVFIARLPAPAVPAAAGPADGRTP